MRTTHTHDPPSRRRALLGLGWVIVIGGLVGVGWLGCHPPGYCGGPADCVGKFRFCVKSQCHECLTDKDCGGVLTVCSGLRCKSLLEDGGSRPEPPMPTDASNLPEEPSGSDDAGGKESPPESQPCSDTELCNDRVDNDCDGMVDEGCNPCAQDADCQSGQVCLDGLCKAGECAKNEDCKDEKKGLVCSASRCVPCTKDEDCDQAVCQTGRCVAGPISTGDFDGAKRWSNGTYAPHCEGYIRPSSPGYVASQTDGAYWIQPQGSAPFRVYCLMSRENGGWTLVMKIDGASSRFDYGSSYWTNTQTYNTSNVDLNRDQAKLASFHTLAMRRLFLGMNDPRGNRARYVVIEKAASSLREVMRKSSFTRFDKKLGRNAWDGLISGESLQNNCNQEGFNYRSPHADYSSVVGGLRIGFIANNESDCDTPDSFIGVGSYVRGLGKNITQAGNYSAGINSDNGKTNIKLFAYLFVR